MLVNKLNRLNTQQNAIGVSANRAPTTLQSSVTQDGVTFNFSKAMPVGQFVDDSYFVVSNSDFTITSITPASGDLQTDSQIGNGTMLNPYVDWSSGGTPEQGFDGYIGETSGGTLVADTAYSASLNVDPGATGSPISITEGDATSVVKTVRNGTVASDTWQIISKYVTLTVLGSAPLADAFPPPASALTKTMRRTSEINRNVFRSITMPGTMPTLTTIESYIPKNTGIYGTFPDKGNNLRRYRLDNALGATSTNYSTHIADEYARACLVMHDDRYTDSEKQDLLYKIINFGLQIDAIYTRSGNASDFLRSGAGQGHAWYPFWVYTAFVLGDSAMLGRAILAETQFDDTYWVDQDRIDNTVPEGDSGNVPQAWFQEMLGMPLISATRDQSNLDSRYGTLGGYGAAWEAVVISFLRNGPSGETGFSWRLNGGSNDNTNDKAAIFGFMDRMREVDTWPMISYDLTIIWPDIYDKFAALSLHTPWSGVPDQAHLGDKTGHTGVSGDFFTAGSGQITWDYSSKGEYHTETITDRAVRYSLDGKQWFVTEGVANTGTISDLMHGASYYVGYRLESASGWGPWSQNYKRLSAGSDRHVITTTGSETAAAPTKSEDPVLMEMLHSKWGDYPGNWTALTAPVSTVTDKVYACGVGDWQGYPAPSFTYQWKLNGSNVSGATSATYTATTTGDTLTCELVATNATDSVTIQVGATGPEFVRGITDSDQAYDANCDLAIPSGITSGNTLVAVLRTGVLRTVNTVPTGWSLVTSNTSDTGVYVYKKTADGTEGGTTPRWVLSGSAKSCFSFIEANAPDGQVEAVIAASSADPASITPTGGSKERIVVATTTRRRNSNEVTAAPSGYTAFSPLTVESSTTNSTSGGEVTLGAAYKKATITSEDPGAFTWTGTPEEGPQAVTIAIW